MNFTPILSTGCLFHLPLEQVAKIGQKAGFKGLELILNSPNLLDNLSQLQEIDQTLPILSLHAPFRNLSLWGGYLKSLEKTIFIAENLSQVQNITLHPPLLRLGQISHFWWFTKSKDLAKDLKSSIPLSLENLPLPGKDPLNNKGLAAHLKLCLDKNLFLTLDICHLGVSGENILSATQKLLATHFQHIKNIHFSDARGLKEHLFPGQGELPLKQFIAKLKEKKYKQLLTLEVGPACLPTEEKEIISTLKVFLKQLTT